MGRRLGLGVGRGRRGQACKQGRVASSPPPSSGTRGLIGPGGLKVRGPRALLAPLGLHALLSQPPTRLPLPRAAHPLRAAPLGSARPGRGREVGARTSEPRARPAEPQEGGEQQEAAGPGPPHPAAPSPGPAPSSTCAARCPPARPGAWRGAAPRAARRGGALQRPGAVARDQRGLDWGFQGHASDKQDPESVAPSPACRFGASCA